MNASGGFDALVASGRDALNVILSFCMGIDVAGTLWGTPRGHGVDRVTAMDDVLFRRNADHGRDIERSTIRKIMEAVSSSLRTQWAVCDPEEFDYETREAYTGRPRLARRYTSAFVMLSRVNKAVREIAQAVLSTGDAVVKLQVDGGCTWAGPVDFDAVLLLIDHAMDAVMVPAKGVQLSMEGAKCFCRVLFHWCAVPQRGARMAFLPVSVPYCRSEVRGPFAAYPIGAGVDTIALSMVSRDGGSVTMDHVLPVMYRNRNRTERTEFSRVHGRKRSEFFEHVLVGDFRFTAKQVAALTTPGTTQESSRVEFSLTRRVEYPSYVVPAEYGQSGELRGSGLLMLPTKLHCWFALQSSNANEVACTCRISWSLCSGAKDADVADRVGVWMKEGARWFGIDLLEKATVLAIAGDFSGPGNLGTDLPRGMYATWQRRISERRDAGKGLQFSAMVGVCQMMTPHRVVHHRLQQLLPREDTDDDEESDGEHTDDEERLYRAMREEGQFVR